MGCSSLAGSGSKVGPTWVSGPSSSQNRPRNTFGPRPANDENPIFDPLLCQINCWTILALRDLRPIIQKNVRNPNHHYFSKKHRNTTPICIAIRLQLVPQYFWCPYSLRKGQYCQYSSHLYRSTSPICIAIRLPFVSQYFWENLGGCGHRNVPQL